MGTRHTLNTLVSKMCML